MTAAVLVACGAATHASAGDREPTAVIELGGAAGYSLKGGGPSGGPDVAVEVGVVPNWLEIEVGVTSLAGRDGTEWDADFVFKKPFDLTDRLELAIGVGPQWAHTTGAAKADAIAAEALVELAYWPHPEHDIGLFVEPSYEYGFSRGHEQSIGLTGGLCIGVP
jgi:hypothetical protein